MIPTIKASKSIIAIAMVLFLFSCTNDPEEVKKVLVSSELPMEVTEDLDLSYSVRYCPVMICIFDLLCHGLPSVQLGPGPSSFSNEAVSTLILMNSLFAGFILDFSGGGMPMCRPGTAYNTILTVY